MSQRLLVKDLKDDSKFRISVALNICPDDERFLVYLNLAEELLLNQGRWVGAIQEAQFCVNNSGCIVLPRQVAVVEEMAVDGVPAALQNGWYGFTRLVTGPYQGRGRGNGSGGCCGVNGSYGGVGAGGCVGPQWRDGQPQCAFAKTRGEHKVIRSYCMVAGDAG